MRDRIIWGLMRLIVRLAYGHWPAAVHIVRELTASEQAEREKAARELAAKVMADLAPRRRYRMGVAVDDTLDMDLPAITSTPIRGDN